MRRHLRPSEVQGHMTGWRYATSTATAVLFAVRRGAEGFKTFRRDERGSIAVLFGVTLLVLLCLVGAAIDFALATAAKARLDAAADAAILSAVNHDALSMSTSAAQTLAENTFKVQAGLNWVNSTTATVTVNDTDAGRTATISYSSQMPTQLMRLAGFNSMALSNSSTATSALPTYIDFYLLLDNTPSMGVAATPTDVTTMVNNTSDKCAFACHNIYTDSGQKTKATNTYYDLAKKLGVTMRIDVVRQATQQLMDTATATATVSDQFRMAIYTFGASCNGTGLTTIAALTSSLSTAKTQAGSIDLMTTPYQNYNSDQCTDFDNVLAGMNNAIPTPGSGTSS